MASRRTSGSGWGLVGLIAALAFFVGIILCIVGGWVRDNSAITLVLVIMGIIVGLFNITAKEIMPFLIAAIALIVAGAVAGTTFDTLNRFANLGDVLNAMLGYLAVFMVPAAIINAVRMVVKLAQPGED